jgi:hypothetical protein
VVLDSFDTQEANITTAVIDTDCNTTQAAPQIVLMADPEIETIVVLDGQGGQTSWVRASLGFTTVLLSAYAVYYAYNNIEDQRLLAQCNGDKKLYRKKKRGSIY